MFADVNKFVNAVQCSAGRLQSSVHCEWACPIVINLLHLTPTPTLKHNTRVNRGLLRKFHSVSHSSDEWWNAMPDGHPCIWHNDMIYSKLIVINEHGFNEEFNGVLVTPPLKALVDPRLHPQNKIKDHCPTRSNFAMYSELLTPKRSQFIIIILLLHLTE